jgi:hypothetical protein
VYSESLQPTVDILNNICEHIIGAMEGVCYYHEPAVIPVTLVLGSNLRIIHSIAIQGDHSTGWDTPTAEPEASEVPGTPFRKSITTANNAEEKRSADKVEMQRGFSPQPVLAGDSVQGSSNSVTAPPKLMDKSSGLPGYVSAMRKATHCVGGERQSMTLLPEALKHANAIAMKFLDTLRAEGQPPVIPAGKGQAGSTVSDTLSHLVSKGRLPSEQQSDVLKRPLPVLAGPAFSPQHWFQGLACNKLDLAEEARRNAEKAAWQGPDVSGLPRPSDKLALAHLQESGELIGFLNCTGVKMPEYFLLYAKYAVHEDAITKKLSYKKVVLL